MRWGIFGVVGALCWVGVNGWENIFGGQEWMGKFFWVGGGGWRVSALFNNGQIKHWTEAIFEQMQDLIQCQQYMQELNTLNIFLRLF